MDAAQSARFDSWGYSRGWTSHDAQGATRGRVLIINMEVLDVKGVQRGLVDVTMLVVAAVERVVVLNVVYVYMFRSPSNEMTECM